MAVLFRVLVHWGSNHAISWSSSPNRAGKCGQTCLAFGYDFFSLRKHFFFNLAHTKFDIWMGDKQTSKGFFSPRQEGLTQRRQLEILHLLVCNHFTPNGVRPHSQKSPLIVWLIPPVSRGCRVMKVGGEGPRREIQVGGHWAGDAEQPATRRILGP